MRSCAGISRRAYFNRFLHADFENLEGRDSVLKYFVDRICPHEDRLVVASWYSENNRDVPLEVLDGETEFSFMEGEAVKFDCFPTLCTTFTAPVLQQPVERSPLLVPPRAAPRAGMARAF